ncbi:hypothetical protein M427DRAFT_135846 [Gonapodya prolifera JEL478]|uniref:Uncharacterized protein n=1 Tax=Gonapodya prolifera (strain JEL478) TaxID=1344416 RepID=A0A139ACB4_GONPJ|nr:hypothetical protein M427DRAFT_135846 [Gonapodya prolifera JEL478]|eukprot:KXS14224.1 hypothetical protein M427DRAFT_135846 [Gonapodya prolifera JEL478]
MCNSRATRSNSVKPNNPAHMASNADASMEVLRKYYGKSNDSQMCMLCLVLHPAYKLAWIRENGWEPHYIKAAELLRDTYDTIYFNPTPTPDPAGSASDDFWGGGRGACE